MRVNGMRAKAVAAVFSLAMVATVSGASTQDRKFEGEIVALDGHADTFTVRASKPGEPVEMTFHVGKKSEVEVEGNPALFVELVRGDRVVVTYETTGTTHTVRRAVRQTTATKELTVSGVVSAVDPKKEMLVVKSGTGSESKETVFHVDPATRLYVGGEESDLLFGFHPGDKVTVTFDSSNPAKPTVKHAKKAG